MGYLFIGIFKMKISMVIHFLCTKEYKVCNMIVVLKNLLLGESNDVCTILFFSLFSPSDLKFIISQSKQISFFKNRNYILGEYSKLNASKSIW
jgi:hypothetical protein